MNEELNAFLEKYPESDLKLKYLQLILEAEEHPYEGYVECHHKVPKSLQGSRKKSNFVRFSAFQHLLAHYYLAKFTQAEPMQRAFWLMSKPAAKVFKNLSELEKASLQEIQDWNSFVESCKNKAVKKTQTKLKEKYGSCTALLNTSESREKAKRARKNRFGTALGRLKDPEVQEKRNAVMIQKYGSLMGHLLTPERMKKARETMVEKYGFLSGQMHTKEAEQKSKETRKRLGNGDEMWGCHNEETKQKIEYTRGLKSKIFKSEIFQEWYKEKKYWHQWQKAVEDFLKEKGYIRENRRSNLYLEKFIRDYQNKL